MQDFQLEEYLSSGTERILRSIVKISDPKGSFFLLQFMAAEKRARNMRREAEERGEHIPPFLIASITSRCNLYCKGCYARANGACTEGFDSGELTGEQWGDIFLQAENLGISFVLLAGGEPLMRRDVLEEAGKHKDLLFPVFTNGTMIGDDDLQMFAHKRNLLPVLSIEGDREQTDARRGDGIYSAVSQTMKSLKERRLLFGVSVTVTNENLKEVTSEEFIRGLADTGCKAVVYVEYVPADGKTQHLAPGEKEREEFERRLFHLRKKQEDMMFISFPGDEKASGGCLAAGRGFFHINAAGSAEPCPFSPYSDTSLVHTSLREALRSPLFLKLRGSKRLEEFHSGGCALFEQEQMVKAMLEGEEA
ncbi:radical SAM protein [Anaerostipes sp.]|uniref:radical SAM protein n=1 Tax=Anaerostipes sp. TaxID=1872530 RepID=UPI0025C49177|nr:radical SAM protein [Anaerostipes sp.]MBS7006827.1 radical SAM protein [Anaerostipes sp.]